MIPILIARFWEKVTGRTKIAQVQKQKLPTDQDRIGWFTGKFAGPTMTQWGKVLCLHASAGFVSVLESCMFNFLTFEMKQTHQMTSWWLAQCEGVAGDASRGAGPKASSSGAGPNVSELPMHTVLVASFLPEFAGMCLIFLDVVLDIF